MRRIRVAGVEEIPENGSKAFLVETLSILICRSAGQLFAVENRCSHNGSALEGGRVRGNFIFCPMHGARFDLRDGSTSGALTKTAVRVFATEQAGDDVFILLNGL